MPTRLGVDVGGTFTDLILVDDETGEVRVAKGPTTPAAPDVGVLEVVDLAASRAEVAVADYFLHGTTVGINALLERSGAVVGLLTTDGFRDVLEARRGDREAMYEMLWKPPPPLVPRRLRLPVRERILADGSVETALVEEDVRAARVVFDESGVDSIAVVFLHAYANPEHELAAKRILRESGFQGEISLSHDVSGEYREYERTSTTVIDAYVRPRVSSYLGRLAQGLGSRGFGGEFLVTRSGGGAMTFTEAGQRPFETVMSGPVAGAVGASELCRDLELDLAITADVGGTSFDTCLIVDGRVHVRYEGSVAGMPLQTSWVDVRSIGAGGGSIAYVDGGGLLRVGPRSAGADPGPACYGRGGREPTVTDAAMVLGMLAHGALAGGLVLDAERATQSLAPLCAPLGLDESEVARGVITIASAAMANAIRSVTVEQGHDPRMARLIAYGGAGPLFATLLARELGVAEVVVPNHAGNFSAWGLLGQDLTRSAAVTSIRALDDAGVAGANEALEKLYEQLARRGLRSDAETCEPAFDLRYSGQEYTLTIAPPASDSGAVAADASTVRELFAASYERTFGHTLDAPVEIVAIRATTRAPLTRSASEVTATSPTLASEQSVRAYSFALDGEAQFAVVDRAGLPDAEPLHGPAIVLETTTTTYVDAGFVVIRDRSGALRISDEAQAHTSVATEAERRSIGA